MIIIKTTRIFRISFYLLTYACALFSNNSFAIEAKTKINDPFDSGILSYHQVHILGNPKNIIYDDNLIIDMPESAEDALQVPVHIDASALSGKVKKIVTFVDYGPIPEILTFYPETAQAKLSFRFKIDQSTVVRAAALTEDGKWHIAGKYISAAGGGCSMPALAYADNNWADTVGRVRGKFWPNNSHLRFTIDHPMDTGLASNIPVFIVQDVAITDDQGKTLARLELHEPVSEDPTISLYLNKDSSAKPLQINGRDNNGNIIKATLPLAIN